MLIFNTIVLLIGIGIAFLLGNFNGKRSREPEVTPEDSPKPPDIDPGAIT